jgi:hypothetical protein
MWGSLPELVRAVFMGGRFSAFNWFLQKRRNRKNRDASSALKHAQCQEGAARHFRRYAARFLQGKLIAAAISALLLQVGLRDTPFQGWDQLFPIMERCRSSSPTETASHKGAPIVSRTTLYPGIFFLGINRRATAVPQRT